MDTMTIHNTPNTNTATATGNYALNGKIMLCSVVVLFAVVVAVICFHAYARCCSYRRHRNYHHRSRGPVALLSGTRPPNNAVDVADAVRAAYRARQQQLSAAGLDPSLLKSLPTFVYGGGAPPAPDCAVCLSEFEDGERGRALPACGHVFHAACIDAWFGSHSSCPLCRSPVDRAESSEADGHVEIAVSDPVQEGDPTVEPGSGFRAEGSDRKPHGLAGLAVRDDQLTSSGLDSGERNRVKFSLKRIWSI